MGDGETTRARTYSKELTCSREDTGIEKIKKSGLPNLKTWMKYTNF